jgi:hypothetical protein
MRSSRLGGSKKQTNGPPLVIDDVDKILSDNQMIMTLKGLP